MRTLKLIWRYRKVVPLLLHLLADVVEASEDGKFDAVERSKIAKRFMAVVEKARR